MRISGLKCLVTGGAGFIGSHLVDELIQNDCTVRVLDNFVNGKLENLSDALECQRFELLKGSVIDPFDVQAAMKDIDVVFHLACLGVRHSIAHPFENHRVNAEGSLIVLSAAHRSKVKRFVFCSSSEVYGTGQHVPMPETHPTQPCTVYGASKLCGEAYARAYHKSYGLETLVVRPFNVYGPRSHHEGDAGEMIPKSIVRALNGFPIIVFGDGFQTRDFTYVKDTVRALRMAADNDAIVGQTVNIGSQLEIPMKDLAHKISRLISETNVRVEFTEPRPGDVLRLLADAKKFENLSGWAPRVSFNEGLEKTISFFRNHPCGLTGLIENECARNWEQW
jgi:UDP-glucose 4-epimerase